MSKRLSKIAILALSLLLLAGMTASAMAANDGQAGMNQQKAQTAIKAVSDLSGLSMAEVRGQRAEGKSPAAIAESEGISEQLLIDKVLAERKAVLNELKAEKKISEEQYQSCLQNMTGKIKANVKRTAADPRNGEQWGQINGKRQGMGQGQGRGAGYGAGRQGNCPYLAPAN